MRATPSAAKREAVLRKAAKRAIHAPMMRVRAGEAVLEEMVLEDVRRAVEEVVGYE